MSTKPGSVIGVKQTLGVLRKMDNALYWECISEIKSAAKPMADSIDGAFPISAPGRGWDHKGRTGWNNEKKTNVKFGGRRSKANIRAQVWPLVRIQVTDAARQIFDMAGSDGGSNINLDKKWGNASRSVWRVAPKLMKETNSAVKKACADTTRKLNRQLTVVR